MTLRLYCDRVEEGIAVLLSPDGTTYHLPADRLPDGVKAEGKHYLCVLRNDAVISAERAETPRAGENKKKLAALFRKSRKHDQKKPANGRMEIQHEDKSSQIIRQDGPSHGGV